MSKRLRPILERLARGETVDGYKEPGNSMCPIIKHRQPVTLSPVDVSLVEKGDVVLAKVSGRFFTHLVSAVRSEKVQISNNKGHVNGWINRSNIFGIVSAVDGVPRSSAASKILRSDV